MLPLRINVEIGNVVKGDMELGAINVLLGSPKTGKSLLLRLIYDALYLLNESNVPGDLKDIANSILRVRGSRLKIKINDLEVECNSEEEEKPVCDIISRDYSLEGYKALFVPVTVEDIVKYGRVPPYEPFEEIWRLITKLKSSIEEEYECSYLKKYFSQVPQADELLGDLKIKSVEGELYELIGPLEVPLRLSSSAVTKLGVLEALAFKGLLRDYNLLLLDEPEASLHPLAQARLSLLLHSLAMCGLRVFIVTHDLLFLDMIRRASYLNAHIFKTRIPVAEDIRLYNIIKGSIRELGRESSFIGGYSEFVFKVYGVEVE